jgi:hypothetical protein
MGAQKAPEVKYNETSGQQTTQELQESYRGKDNSLEFT